MEMEQKWLKMEMEPKWNGKFGKKRCTKLPHAWCKWPGHRWTSLDNGSHTKPIFWDTFVWCSGNNCTKETTTSLRGCGCRKIAGGSCPYEILLGTASMGNASFIYQSSHQSQESGILKESTVFRGNRLGNEPPVSSEIFGSPYHQQCISCEAC